MKEEGGGKGVLNGHREKGRRANCFVRNKTSVSKGRRVLV